MNGPTDLDNLALVCNAHHHQIHDDGWTLAFRHTPSGLRWTLTPPRPNVLDAEQAHETESDTDTDAELWSQELVGAGAGP
jgi:hypothetical protein